MTLDELLGDAGIDAVYIAVPHDRLASLARQALESGKHALVEKPLALTLADVDDLIGLAARRRLALGVFYELRHATPFVQAHSRPGGKVSDIRPGILRPRVVSVLAWVRQGVEGPA